MTMVGVYVRAACILNVEYFNNSGRNLYVTSCGLLLRKLIYYIFILLN